MAENETLDLDGRNSGRWRNLARLIFRRAPNEKVRDKFVRNVCTTLQNIYKDIPVEALLRAAAGEDGDAERLVRDCRKHRDYARLFLHACGQGLDRQGVAEDVCWQIADSILDQIGVTMMQTGEGLDVSQVPARFAAYKLSLSEPIADFAHQMALDPDRAPRRPPVPREVKQQRHRELLTMSLLRQ